MEAAAFKGACLIVNSVLYFSFEQLAQSNTSPDCWGRAGSLGLKKTFLGCLCELVPQQIRRRRMLKNEKGEKSWQL